MSGSHEPVTGIDPRGPRVTAGITGIVVLVVVALGLVGLTTAATVLLAAQAIVFLVAAIVGAAFVVAFLNSVFGYCVGCQIYLLLARIGVIRRKPAAA